jgi:zinc finger CCCH domain-containing protein 13
MATTEKNQKKGQQTSTQHEQNAVDKVGEALAKTDLQEDDSLTDTNEQAEQIPRPLHVYRRYEILQLSKSPLVKPPDDMPQLKDWFGYVVTSVTLKLLYTDILHRYRDWNEQVGSKKDTEPSGNAANPRDRRCAHLSLVSETMLTLK